LIQFRTGSSVPDDYIILRLWKIIRGNDYRINISEPVPSAGWHHIDVTRTPTGVFSVYLNGSLSMRGVDRDIDTSEMFWLNFQEGQMIDNIEVTPSPSQPPLWGLSVAVVVFVVVIWVVCMFIRRRRTE
jgi:hypothetical protein